jgi:pimeloyl-ACP methyl ester carboxylesterase
MSDLHVTSLGSGERVLFVHGSFVRGGAAWAGQRPLADRYRLLFVDRRGFGGSPETDHEDFDRDAEDVAELLGDGAHLVGHSYGAIVSLIAAGRRPDAVRSLAVVEPPAFHLAPESAAARSMRERVGAVLARASAFTPQAFLPVFLEAMGYDLQTLRLRSWSYLSAGVRPDSIAAFRTSMYQRLPWEADVPLELLRMATFPKLVISGGWDTASPATRATAGAALQDVCDVIARRIDAQRTVIPGAFHAPQSAQPAAFNARLGAFLDDASNVDASNVDASSGKQGAAPPGPPGPPVG